MVVTVGELPLGTLNETDERLRAFTALRDLGSMATSMDNPPENMDEIMAALCPPDFMAPNRELVKLSSTDSSGLDIRFYSSLKTMWIPVHRESLEFAAAIMPTARAESGYRFAFLGNTVITRKGGKEIWVCDTVQDLRARFGAGTKLSRAANIE